MKITKIYTQFSPIIYYGRFIYPHLERKLKVYKYKESIDTVTWWYTIGGMKKKFKSEESVKNHINRKGHI